MMLNQNSRPVDFVLGSCPNCEKVVRIPVTAFTSQSRAHVRCPICDESFELAAVLEKMIPAVEVIDQLRPVAKVKTPDRINAIDTPELFHIAKADHEPITAKKNGRFIVPELLSRGIRKKKKRSRRRSRSSEEDARLAESLAKLKANSSNTSMLASADSEESTSGSDDRSSRSRHSNRSSRSKGSESPEKNRSGRSRSSRKTSIERIPTPSLIGIRSWADFREFTHACKSLLKSRFKSQHASAARATTRSEVLLVVIGALFAIPVLHLMMWWFVGIDPLGLAKPTSHVAPFFVPRELQAAGSEEIDMEPVQPSKQVNAEDRQFQQPATQTPDGKLPKPNLDPSSVHSGNFSE